MTSVFQKVAVDVTYQVDVTKLILNQDCFNYCEDIFKVFIDGFISISVNWEISVYYEIFILEEDCLDPEVILGS